MCHSCCCKAQDCSFDIPCSPQQSVARPNEKGWRAGRGPMKRATTGAKHTVSRPLFYNEQRVRTFAIGNPERHVRKASHRGSKQQWRSPDEITLVVTVSKHNQLFTRFTSIIRGHSPRSLHRDHSINACSRHIHILLFFAHIPFVANHKINATPSERLQHY